MLCLSPCSSCGSVTKPAPSSMTVAKNNDRRFGREEILSLARLDCLFRTAATASLPRRCHTTHAKSRRASKTSSTMTFLSTVQRKTSRRGRIVACLHSHQPACRLFFSSYRTIYSFSSSTPCPGLLCRWLPENETPEATSGFTIRLIVLVDPKAGHTYPHRSYQCVLF